MPVALSLALPTKTAASLKLVGRQLGVGEDVQADPTGDCQDHEGLSLCRGIFGRSGAKPRHGRDAANEEENDGKSRAHAANVNPDQVSLKSSQCLPARTVLRSWRKGRMLGEFPNRPRARREGADRIG